MRPLRAALTRIAYDLAEGSRPPIPIDPPRPDDIATVNAAAAVPPLVPALRPDGGTTFLAPTAAAALSTLARDAVDLFGGPLARRIRVCAAENCGLLLVDTSRPGRRRWCSMELSATGRRSGPIAPARDPISPARPRRVSSGLAPPGCCWWRPGAPRRTPRPASLKASWPRPPLVRRDSGAGTPICATRPATDLRTGQSTSTGRRAVSGSRRSSW